METNSSISRSGGKMLRPRRPAARRTPYDRPPPHLSTNHAPQNPNWMSRLIFSPSRMLATGAGKVLASVFAPEPSSSSSSSSGSEYDSDDVSEEEQDISSQPGDLMELERPEQVGWKSETKRLVAQLLMQETFSRGESDRLVSIIKSRVVDSLVGEGRPGAMGEQTNVHDVAAPDQRDAAVTEAKRWLEGKRLGSSSKSELGHGTSSLYTAMLPHVGEAEQGSPADVAKSYMQARPPWASPSIDHIQLQPASPAGMQLCKEATPRSYGSASASKLKMESPAAGSWNIQEELRKVRSRATQEMLKSRASSKIDWPAPPPNFKAGPSLFETSEVHATTQDKVCDPAQLVDVPLDWSNPATVRGCSDSQIVHNGSQNILWAIPINLGRGEGVLSYEQQHQPSEDAIPGSQSAAGSLKDATKDNQSFTGISIVGGTTQDAVPPSRSLEINCSSSMGAAAENYEVATNGFPTSGSSLSAGHERGEEPTPSNEGHNPFSLNEEKMTVTCNEDRNQVTSSQDMMARDTPAEEACQVFSEASVEVLITNETENAGVASPSQNSSTMHDEELSEDLSRPKTRRGLAGKKSTVTEAQQQGMKVTRYNRRGRGRGK